MIGRYGNWWDYTLPGMAYNWWTGGDKDPAELQREIAEAAQRGDIAEAQRLNNELNTMLAEQITFAPVGTVAPGVEAGMVYPTAPGQSPIGVGNIGTAARPQVVGAGGQQPQQNGKGPKPGTVIGVSLAAVLGLGLLLALGGGGKQRRRR